MNRALPPLMPVDLRSKPVLTAAESERTALQRKYFCRLSKKQRHDNLILSVAEKAQEPDRYGDESSANP